MPQDPTGEAAGNAQKQLTLYELDLGLNHVTRKWSQEVDNGANLLVPVPGGADGPGGVLVCAENFIIYSNQVQFCVSPSLTRMRRSRRRTATIAKGMTDRCPVLLWRTGSCRCARSDSPPHLAPD